MKLNIERIKKTAEAAVDLVKDITEDPLKYVEAASKELELQRHKICEKCVIRTGNQCDPTKCISVDNQTVCGCGCYLPVAITRRNKECPRKIWPGEQYHV